MPPPVIPGYDLLSPLGGGALATVYLARQAESDRLCVVKCPGAGPDAVKLLQREARAGLAVRHPHLVRLIDARVTAAPYYLAFQHIAGESLRERLQRTYTLDVRTALWVARQLADALTALHRAGFVHADVKPDNVMLSASAHATLIDLGFCHRPGEATFGDCTVLGTPNYFAPEQCDLQGGPAVPSDWFAFGLVLWEMLAGAIPHTPSSVADLLLDRRHRDLREALPLAGPGWPGRLVDLLAMLLDPLPSGRPVGRLVVSELVALEIAQMGRRAA